MASLPFFLFAALALAQVAPPTPSAPPGPLLSPHDIPNPFPRVKGEKGFWIGRMRLCGGGAVTVTRTTDLLGYPALTIALPPALKPLLKAETERLLGRQMTIRVDGETISAPNVNETISGGTLAVTGMDEATMKAVERAAKAPC